MNVDCVYESDYDAQVHYGLPACHRVRVTMQHVLAAPGAPEGTARQPEEIPLHPLGQHQWTIQFDPNLCVLDDFGDVESATRMYAWPWTMKLTFVKTGDGKAVYDVELAGADTVPAAVAGPYTGLPLRLVAFGATAGGHPERLRLLVFNKQGSVVQMIELLKRRVRHDARGEEEEEEDS